MDLISKELSSNPEALRRYLQESLIFDVGERMCEAMEEQRVSRGDLAEKLGRTKGYITQVLRGNANLTLRTVADVFWALGKSVDISLRPSSSLFERERVSEDDAALSISFDVPDRLFWASPQCDFGGELETDDGDDGDALAA